MSVFIGLVSVAVAVAALWLETKRSRLATQADILMRLDDRFTSPTLRRLRRAASTKLLAGDAPNLELHEVLDFLCNVAYMVNEGALETRLAFSAFEYWTRRYWYAGQSAIAQERELDPGSWDSLERLLRKFERIRSRRRLENQFRPEEIEHFLQEETRLLDTL